jgi:serine protease Do
MRIGLGIILAFTLAGSSFAQTARPAPAPAVEIVPLPIGVTVRPVSLTKMAADIRPGSPWITFEQKPFACIRQSDPITWKAEGNQIGEDGGFQRTFREELGKAGFKFAGDATNLFEQETKASDLQVGALIKDMQLSFCYFDSDRQLDPEWFRRASSRMDVEWQIYSVSQGKVLARIGTTGNYALNNRVDNPIGFLIGGAFTDNVQRLAMSDEFRSLVTSAPGTPAAKPTAISFKPGAAQKRPLADAAGSVVAIFAGAGMGSGFLISDEGYILTNHHVVGGADRIRVRWADGAETTGEVVRSDRRRDVALVKVAAGRRRPMAISAGAPALGQTVFAIGTPLDPKLQNTVTRGIVSSSRTVEGQTFIQSDVAVTHGNSGGPLLDENGAAIGLTVLGLYPAESKSLNLFIPIGDALDVLALKPAG